MTAPRLTALGAADQQRLELLTDARAIVVGTTRMLPTTAMLVAAIDAIDTQAKQLTDADALLDSKSKEIDELHEQLADAQEKAGTAMAERDAACADVAAHQALAARMEEDQQGILAESLEAQRQLTAEREKNTALNIRLSGLSTQLATVSRLVEQALVGESIAHQLQSRRFTELTAIRDAADPSAAVPTDISITNYPPRMAAAGGQ